MNQYTSVNRAAGAASRPRQSKYRFSAYQAAARLVVFASTNNGTTDRHPATNSETCNHNGIGAL